MFQEAVCAIFLIVGSTFIFIAGLGMLRMPDLFMRMSASTKASTLGVGFLLTALAFKFTQLDIVSRAVAVIVFVILTAPVAAHMIGRAAYIAGVPLWYRSVIDELCGQYDRCDHRLGSIDIRTQDDERAEGDA
ncbi:MAG: monovalent cation/H(+) antiporter subunit G [Syntrophobacteraceae bacterium]|jgi:multicomponent Na+:H+ antiporter subunit G|nr:monovalent cation/H(+) antiporter subunit G [Syntrophobacteraceae bacterium]